MTAVLDSIRRIVAEDAAHGGVTHELYLRRETHAALQAIAPPSVWSAPDRKRVTHLLGHKFSIQNVGRDCIATLRGGQIISVTNL